MKWYDWLRWLLDRADSFPKYQRFIFGTRLADRAIDVLELLVEAAYSSEKQHVWLRRETGASLNTEIGDVPDVPISAPMWRAIRAT